MTLRSLRLAAICTVAAMAVVTVPALSQNTTTQVPTNTPAVAQTGDAMKVDTPTFLRLASSSNQFEILSSRLAEQQASNEQVKAFATQMIADHTAAGEKMRAAVQQAGLQPTAMPETEGDLDARHKEMLDQIARAEGNFDEAYVRAQYQAHQEAVRLFNSYAESGDQSAIKAFAAETLPVLQQHLAHVSELPGAPQGGGMPTGAVGGAESEGMSSDGTPPAGNNPVQGSGASQSQPQ